MVSATCTHCEHISGLDFDRVRAPVSTPLATGLESAYQVPMKWPPEFSN
jgi:hypothetical protein